MARMAPALLRHVNPQSVRTALELLRRGDVATLRTQVRWLMAPRELEGDSAPALDARTSVVVDADPWPPELPLASVVVECFDEGTYVRDAVDSVVAQTAVELCEVIVVDGGSTDVRTLESLRRLEADPPPRTRVLLQGGGRNAAVEQARGRYVGCLAADELLDPTYIEVALYLLERRGYDLVSTPSRGSGRSAEGPGLPSTPDLRDLSGENSVSSAAVYRRALWELAGGYDDSPGVTRELADWKLWARMAALGARVTSIPEPLHRDRVYTSSGPRDPRAARAAVQAYNADVDTPAARAESARRRGLEITVEGAYENLTGQGRHRPTILLAVPFLVLGGAERLLSTLAAHLSRSGFRIVVVSTLYAGPEAGDSTPWFERATAEIYHLPRLLEPRYAADFLAYVIETKQVDVLLIVGSELAYRQLPSLSERYPALGVADLHFNASVHMETSRDYASHIDVHFCENAEVRDLLLARGRDEESVVLVESGVDISEYRPLPRPPTEKFRVGYSGRLAEEKAPLAFVDLAEAVDDPRFEFVITGAGPLEGRVRRRLEQLTDRSAHFLGVVDDIRAHLASLDVLILPSVMDGRPIVVLEALALGVPVIATRVGGVPALVRDGETGFLVEPGDTEAMARHLRRLVDDPRELEELRRSARAFAERHLDVHGMNEAYESALRALMSRDAAVPSAPAASGMSSAP